MPDDHDHDAAAAERAWQAIVENFGERAELDDDPQPPAVGPASGGVPDAPFAGRFGDPRAFDAGSRDGSPDVGEPEDERYVPPPPPPLPEVAPDRGLAWAGVFGAPTVLLVVTVLQVSVPAWLGYLLVAAFVGGFGYLVATMPRGPRDPWDDGAQV